ncbi:general transcription factor IIF subunit 1 [Dendroctonus ponderosae]
MAAGSSSQNVSVQEFTIRVPKMNQRKYHVMRFNGNLGVDFAKWTQVKMERENNMKEFKGIDEEQPKFGAGSEFGREAKEEARRKKLGIVAKKYRPDDQPWILKCFGSTVKKFKGIREGGISENTAYYVFTHAEDGAIEAFPLYEWYKFQSIQRYKALSAEEAEMEFNKRNKHLNFFSLMMRKRLKGEDDADLDEDGEKSKKTSKKKDKELKISDMDEWMDSSDGDSDSDGDEKVEEEDDGEKSKKKKKGPPKPKKKRDTDLEAVEDSDDGDEEGRELDYISDSSESEPENTNLDGVSEEKGLKKLLNSDEEESEDSDKEDKDKNNEEDEKEDEAEKKADDDKDKKKKKKDKKSKDKKKKENDPDDDFSSDSSSDDDTKKKKSDKKDKEKNDSKFEPVSENSSRAASPTVDGKRKIINDVIAGPSKKPKLDLPNFIPGLAESGVTEDSVRKYLMRKPMTATELLQKFKSKKTGLSSEQLVNFMTQILKKINPTKQTLKGKMYLSIKA